MTDNEFIELLDSISSDVIASNNEDVFTVGDVLDLIKRKDAEVERLNSLLELEKFYETLTNECLKTAKSDAIKEFAERLKDIFPLLEALPKAMDIVMEEMGLKEE